MKGKKGRPKGKETIKVHALLYPEQKAKLEFLSSHLIGSPPVAGLLRQAVDEFLERHFTAAYAAEYEQRPDANVQAGEVPHESLRLVR